MTGWPAEASAATGRLPRGGRGEGPPCTDCSLEAGGTDDRTPDTTSKPTPVMLEERDWRSSSSVKSQANKDYWGKLSGPEASCYLYVNMFVNLCTGFFFFLVSSSLGLIYCNVQVGTPLLVRHNCPVAEAFPPALWPGAGGEWMAGVSCRRQPVDLNNSAWKAVFSSKDWNGLLAVLLEWAGPPPPGPSDTLPPHPRR